MSNLNLLSTIKNGAWKQGLKSGVQCFGMKMIAIRPEIMLVAGGLSLLAGTIYACTKTEEAKKVVEETKNKAKDIEKLASVEENSNVELSSETKKQLKLERGRQYTGLYAHTAYELLKIYGIPALLWFGGMGMIIYGHGELRSINRTLAADIFAGNTLLQEYRGRVAKAVGKETEEKIFLGAQEGMVKVIEEDPETGEKKVVEKQANVFVDQPGSIFALNFTNETSDAFDIRSFADHYLQSRIDGINAELELGIKRVYTAMDIYRMLGFNENSWKENEEFKRKLTTYGISGNARKVPDPEMRKLKVTRLQGYQKRWDIVQKMEVYEPCLRLDFNFYPIEGTF